MGPKISRTIAPALKQLQERFTGWREAEHRGRRIPAELWEAATELAREVGVNPVCKSIGLDYKRLKRRVVGSDSPREQIAPEAGTFVELAMDTVAGTSACVIEFEGRRGRLTIRLTEHNPTEVLALAKALVRSER